MRDSEIRVGEAVVRMRDFRSEYASDFPPTSLGGQLFTELDAIATD